MSLRAPVRFLIVPAVLLNIGTAGSAEDSQPAEAKASVDDAQRTEAKQIFGAQCGFCHGDYGMAAAKGPQLAGTEMTEREVEQRIRNGKPGFMPSFRKSLSDDQIALMARYIKALKPND
ncbi:MAG TPA: cytochrome c [Rhodopila sp.]